MFGHLLLDVLHQLPLLDGARALHFGDDCADLPRKVAWAEIVAYRHEGRFGHRLCVRVAQGEALRLVLKRHAKSNQAIRRRRSDVEERELGFAKLFGDPVNIQILNVIRKHCFERNKAGEIVNAPAIILIFLSISRDNQKKARIEHPSCPSKRHPNGCNAEKQK